MASHTRRRLSDRLLYLFAHFEEMDPAAVVGELNRAYQQAREMEEVAQKIRDCAEGLPR